VEFPDRRGRHQVEESAAVGDEQGIDAVDLRVHGRLQAAHRYRDIRQPIQLAVAGPDGVGRE